MKCGNSKKIIFVIMAALLPVFPVLLAGCWNNRDLTEINIVAGIGLERTEEGKILLTIQVVEPGAIQSSSDKGKSGGQQQKPVFVESSEGETVFEAVRGLLSVIDKKLFFSTAQVLILGERLSQEGIEEAMDFFHRDHEFDYEMNILVAKGATPKEILEIESDIDSIPAVYINSTVENTVSRGTVKKTMLINLIKDMGGNEKQLAVGQISKAGEKSVRTEGTAVFRDGKLAGWLDPYETRGYLFAVDEIESAIINVHTDNGKIAMEIIRSKGKINVAFENGEPSALNIKVKVEANVGEYQGKGKLEASEDLDVLRGLLEDEIKKEIRMAVEKVQEEYHSDIFGFGTYVRKYHPKYWKKSGNNWLAIFSELPVDIQVDAKIMRTGIVKSPVN